MSHRVSLTEAGVPTVVDEAGRIFAWFQDSEGADRVRRWLDGPQGPDTVCPMTADVRFACEDCVPKCIKRAK